MRAAITGFQYLVSGLLGFVMAFLPTLLISWAIFPPDGPIGEGLTIMAIYFVSSCVCIPCYVALMALHREGRRDTRMLVAGEIGLRISMVVAGSFLCFMAVKLPTQVPTKALFCLLPAVALAWSINPKSWNPVQQEERALQS